MLNPSAGHPMRNARGIGALFAIVGVGCLLATPAFAAEAPKHLAPEATLIIQIVLLILVGRLIGEIMTRMGQPSVMGQFLGGILLGPPCWGCSCPPAAPALPALGRSEGDDPGGRRVRGDPASAADRHGDRSEAGAPCRAGRPQRRRRRNLRTLHRRRRLRQFHAGDPAPEPGHRLVSSSSSARRSPFPRSRSWPWSCAT